ncbi:leucyl/phenylalanyl-tRNA--protein transferase [Nocardioides nematodiphilus]|uniref:leucyl/phenylalanyl-tRNA--protein transferase n=1 Tax=Nocardioides nematodiphilus TaxID=2849669 RepID=UPI001CD9E813|nr:leucyl/phenylalanyl-tRNA--protein transferase [Nocardioides nematodiphilus]MCA1981856.1 leucyl/phenylalanyl-tRNA--protein transferase [Nocardioides nematodiphilus]
MPTEPPATPWMLPDLRTRRLDAQLDDMVAIGADLAPGTLLAAYRLGLFPMPGDEPDEILWFSPVLRGVLPLEGLRVTSSLRKSLKHFEIRVDTAFRPVMEACADPARDGGWINDDFINAYEELHRLGWAHSVEAWQDGELVGGLYGLEIGGLFAGESMFHRARDASKAALVGLVSLLRAAPGPRVLDVQWRTDHLASLGVIEIPRADYLELLDEALPSPAALG